MKYYGALEAGGTKMVLSILDGQGEILLRRSIPTRTPEETLPEMIAFFREHPVSALGLASFGPVELHPDSPAWGYITATPKEGWRMVPILQAFREALGIPVGFDTDVNAAALSEARLGAGRGVGISLYVTVGTGIGGGIAVEGRALHGLVHPELGHMLLVPEKDDPAPEGFCPYHKHCLEGLASGPAMEKRWGVPAQALPQDHPAWELEAAYLAQMCHNLIMTVSPEKIILGGGVMHQAHLLPRIRRKTLALLGGYVFSPAVDGGLEDYIVSPALGDNSGVMGAYLLAREAEKA